MGASRAVLIFSAVLAHAAIAQASTAAPDGTSATSASAASSAATSSSGATAPNDAGAVTASPERKAHAPASHIRTAWFSKSDLRYCLERKSNEAIIRCAEGLE